jgi:hypothetical protein
MNLPKEIPAFIGENLSLTLLVLGHFTDHANLAVTVNHLALIANLLD